MKKLYYILSIIFAVVAMYGCTEDPFENSDVTMEESDSTSVTFEFALPEMAEEVVESRASSQLNVTNFSGTHIRDIFIFIFEDTNNSGSISDSDARIYQHKLTSGEYTWDASRKLYTTTIDFKSLDGGKYVKTLSNKKCFVRIIINPPTSTTTKTARKEKSDHDHYHVHYWPWDSSEILEDYYDDWSSSNNRYDDVNYGNESYDYEYFKDNFVSDLGGLYTDVENYGTNDTSKWQSYMPMYGKYDSGIQYGRKVTVPVKRLYSAVSVDASSISSKYTLTGVAFATKNPNYEDDQYHYISSWNFSGTKSIYYSPEADEFTYATKISNNTTSPAIPFYPSCGGTVSGEPITTDLIIRGKYKYDGSNSVDSYHKIRIANFDGSTLRTDFNTHYILKISNIDGPGFNSYEEANTHDISSKINYITVVAPYGGSTDQIREISKSRYGYYMGLSNSRTVIYDGIAKDGSTPNPVEVVHVGYGNNAATTLPTKIYVKSLNTDMLLIGASGSQSSYLAQTDVDYWHQGSHVISVKTLASDKWKSAGAYATIEVSLGDITKQIKVYKGGLALNYDTTSLDILGTRDVEYLSSEYSTSNSAIPSWLSFATAPTTNGDHTTYAPNSAGGFSLNIAPKSPIDPQQSITHIYCTDEELGGTRVYIAQNGLVWEGDGTTGNPYRIYNVAQFKAFRDFVDNQTKDPFYGGYFYTKCFKLYADIDLENEPFDPIGQVASDGKIIRPYTGTFLGNNGQYEITGLNIVSNKNEATGLFAGLSGSGVIKSLTVSGHVENTTNSTIGVGGIVGYMTDQTVNKLQGCNFTGSVKGYQNVGGICGVYKNSGSADSYTNCSIKNCKTGAGTTVEAIYKDCGGIIGATRRMTIENCQNAAAVKAGNMTAGGVVGYLGLDHDNDNVFNTWRTHYFAKITGCKNTGTATAPKYAANIAAYADWYNYSSNDRYPIGYDSYNCIKDNATAKGYDIILVDNN